MDGTAHAHDEDRARTTTIVLTGPLDARTTYVVREALYAVLGAPEAGDVVLDLTECPWIDGTGLRMLAVATVVAHRSGLHVYLRGAAPSLRRTLHTARLRPLIDLDPVAS